MILMQAHHVPSFPQSRRQFLRFGLSAFGTVALSEVFRRRAAASPKQPRSPTAIIVVWLRGGASHLETYDPKPNAPAEYRGPYSTISTRTPGLAICELLPRHAKIADKFSILRSMAHSGGGHPAGSLQLLSGDPDAQDKLKPTHPDFMSVAHFLRPSSARTLPNYVGVNPIHRYDNFQIAGPAFLGSSYEPFAIHGDPNEPNFKVPNIGLPDSRQAGRIKERLGLRQQFERFRREADQAGVGKGMDAFEAQALNLLTSPDVARAFDLNQESAKLRERYGRNRWGQQCLLARRLVEAGVEVVTTTLDGPLCGRVANWDDHAVNHHVFDALKFRAPYFDQAVTALIEDVFDRGLDRRVLVVVTGEFGRTPRISYVASSGGGVASAPAGTVQPGRDHWPRANSMLWAGGGIRGGQVIGATDRRGEDVVSRRIGPHDFLATIYHHLGIDAANVTIPDFQGRPTPILQDGKPIAELQARA